MPNGASPKRKGWIENGIGFIPLTKGLVALVDPEMVEYLCHWNWCATQRPSGDFYAIRRTEVNYQPKQVSMSNQILGLPHGVLVDHENLNTLDNRASNLRPANKILNSINRPLIRTNTSGFKGVTWNKFNQNWMAQITLSGEHKYLGSFATPEEAHQAYRKAAREHYGEFARFE